MLKRIAIACLLLCVTLLGHAQLNYAHFIMKARMDLNEGRFKEGIADLNVAIESQPKNFEGYFLRGIAKCNLEDYFGAIADFDKALEINPMYVRALQFRAICHDQLSNFNDALDDFQTAINFDPIDAELYFARGATYMHLQQFEKAIDDYNMVLSIKNDLSLAYVNRGLAKSHLKRHDEALADMNKGVYYDFLNPETYFRRGLVQIRAEAFPAALDDFNEAIRLDDDNPLYYFNRAVAELELHDTLAAMNDYEKVNQLDPRNALTYFNRGVIYGSMKEHKKALEMFDMVTLINPNNIYGYFNRSIVNCEMKRWKAAEADLTKVLELFPEYVSAWVNRSIVRAKRGNRNGSEADHQTAMNLIQYYNNDKNAEALYKQYADSVYLSKIIAFESDFVNGEMKQNQIQYADVEIVPYGNFVLTFVGNEEYKLIGKGKGLYLDAQISRANDRSRLPAKLALKPENKRNAIGNTLINDADIARCADAELRLMLQGISEQSIFNLQKAEDCYTQLLQDDQYADYATLNLSSVLMSKAEMMAMANQSRMEVTITTGKAKQPETKPVVVDYTNAINLLAARLTKDRNDAFLWYNLANAFLQSKDYNKAIDAYSEAILHDAQLAEAYYNRALTLVFIGETKLAMSDLSKAGELGLSEAYVVMKRFGK